MTQEKTGYLLHFCDHVFMSGQLSVLGEKLFLLVVQCLLSRSSDTAAIRRRAQMNTYGEISLVALGGKHDADGL